MGRIIGERIALREYRSEDLSAIRAWVNDTETTKFLSGAYRRPQSWEQTEEWLQRRLNGDAGGEAFVIADKSTLNYMGQCDLFMIDNVARKAELAIILVKDARGKGYAREAIRLICDYAFNQLNLNRVWLRVAEQNQSAMRAYARAGFTREGVLRQDMFIDGRYEDVLIMGLLAREYNAARA